MVYEARRDLDDVAAAALLHLGDRELRHMEESRQVDAEDRCVIGLAVLCERFRDEYASVVDKGVDAPEPDQAFGDRTLGRLSVGNVARHHQDLVIVGWPDGPCSRDHPIIAIAIRLDKGRADALRGTGDDGNSPFAAHARLLHPSEPQIFRRPWTKGGPFHSNAGAGEDEFQLSVGAMSNRRLPMRSFDQ